MKHLITALLFGLLCLSPMVSHASATTELTVMTHDSFSISQSTLDAFQKAEGASVVFLKSGDAGAALNQAILAKRNPLADVFFGVDNTFFSRAIKADIFVSYDSPMLKKVPAALQLDPQKRLLPISFGDVCLNYDKAWFKNKGIRPPSSLEDLVKPELKNLTVVQNPATSSPGLAFLLATIGHFGEQEYITYWKKLRANGVKITNGWKEAYWGDFTAASDGARPIVVSYASSPAAEVYYAKKKPSEAPTAAVLSPGSGFRQIEFAGILKGTKQPELAQKFIDFMLSTMQADIPLQMWVYPARKKTALPDVFKKYASAMKSPATIPPATIATKREKWIRDWTAAVLY